MDRRNFLALGGVAAVAGSGLSMSAAVSEKLMARRIP